MDLQALKYFQFVAMYRNFSRAAEHFYIGQSALSRQVANLEKELGVRLFDRDTRNVALTDAGQVLYDNCDLLLRHHDLVDRAIEAAKRGFDGQLSIATVANFGTTFVEVVRRFVATYPRVKVRVDDIPFDELSDSILNGVYDAAFTVDFEVTPNDQIVRTTVGEDRFVAVCAAGGPLGDATTTEQLLDCELIVPRHVDPPFLRRLRLRGREQPGEGEITIVPNTVTAMLRVELGLGVTVIPWQVLESSFDAQRFHAAEITDLDTGFEMVLIRRKDNAQTTLTNFLALVQEGRRSRRMP